MNQEKMKNGISLFLEGLGVDLTDQHIVGTPDRIVRAWANEFGKGHDVIRRNALMEKCKAARFVCDSDEMIVVKDIPILSHCAHHLVPFFGKIKIGYVPQQMAEGYLIVGLSKLARVADHFASQLQIQEKLTKDIVTCIEDILDPQGVGVVIEAEHFCMSQRGIKKPGSKTVTSKLTGVLREDPRARAEFLGL